VRIVRIRRRRRKLRNELLLLLKIFRTELEPWLRDLDRRHKHGEKENS
jgi:hypothetical protein